MSKITKGILGGCSGKIGGIMGYQRNGKAIIQRVPTIDKSNNPIARLSKQGILNTLSIWLANLPPTAEAIWNQFLGSPTYDANLALAYNTPIINSLHAVNCQNLIWAPTQQSFHLDFITTYNNTTRVIEVFVNPLTSTSILSEYTRLEITKINHDYSRKSLFKLIPNSRAKYYSVTVDQADAVNAQFFVIQFIIVATLTRSDIKIIDPVDNRL